MRVKEIVIDGFKSYAKRTVISNWDPQFNCITGLNGSGKSNILDAICFVLGITSMQTVRAQNQQDLIYKRGQAGITKASVSIVFDNSDKTRSPLAYREVDSITVTRQVVLGGTSKYLINGHRAQQTQVQQLFQEVQLNVNNPNFLIMQGQITKVVNMQPTEILSLIEEAAGTGMYEKERLRAVKEIKDRDGPLRETEQLLNEEVRPKLERLRAQKRDFLEFQQCASSTEALERVVAGSQFAAQQQHVSQRELEAEESKRRLEHLKASLEAETARGTQLETELADLKHQSQRSEEAARLDRELQASREEHALFLTTLEHKQQQLAQLIDKKERSTAALEPLRAQLAQHIASVGTFEQEHTVLEEKLKKHRQFTQERQDLVSGLTTGISTTGEREVGYAQRLKVLRSRANTTKEARDKLLDRKKELIQQLKSQKQAAEEVSKEISKAEAEMANSKSREEELRVRLQQFGDPAKVAELRQKLNDARDNRSQLSRAIDSILSQYPNLSLPYELKGMDRVHGRVATLVKLKSEHRDKSVALEATSGGEMWSIVVDDESTGTQVLRRVTKRTTVLPLNRIKSNSISSEKVREIDGNGAWLAMDLLEFDEKVRTAVQFAFGRTVVCATDKIAERAAFKFGVFAVTLEGDIFDPRGIVSGGSRAKPARNSGSTLSTVFGAASEYTRISEEQAAAENLEKNLQAELSSLDANRAEFQQLSRELQLLTHQASIGEERVQKLKSQEQEFTSRGEELETLQSRDLPEAEAECLNAVQEVEREQSAAEEFNRDKSGKLLELQAELQAALNTQKQLEKQLTERKSAHIANQQETVRLQTDIEQETEDVSSAERGVVELQKDIDELNNTSVHQAEARIQELSLQLEREVSKEASIRNQVEASEREIDRISTSLADMRLEIQQVGHQQIQTTEALVNARNSLQAVSNRWNWASSASEELQADNRLAVGNHLEQLVQKLAHEQRRMQSLSSRVDASVVGMIERLEVDEQQLRQRLATIKNDRKKLEETMETLTERRRGTIDEVWQQVSRDFGLIFNDLLPNSACELVPVNGRPIEEGLAIRARLGATWKEGLTELSGGQRSLVALSLILALLRYHPAPVYILDEVDAALDVHHTRNIGMLIKNRFQNAQFIVVSLKDDMFTNANRIFQTRFVGGTSTVQIMQ